MFLTKKKKKSVLKQILKMFCNECLYFAQEESAASPDHSEGGRTPLSREQPRPKHGGLPAARGEQTVT